MTGKLLDPRKEFGKAVYDVAVQVNRIIWFLHIHHLTCIGFLKIVI